MHDGVAIVKASRRSSKNQLLFLVREDNAHDLDAVMLHDGVRKLGNVLNDKVKKSEIRKILDDEANAGEEKVIVVNIDWLPDSAKYKNDVEVRGVGLVNERAARKYAKPINTAYTA